MMSARASIALWAVLLALGVPAAAGDPHQDKAVGNPAASPAVMAAGETGVPGDEVMVVTVNGLGISQSEFDRNWKYFIQRSGLPATHADASGQMNELRRQVLDRLVDEELLFQESKRTGRLSGNDAIEAEITKARGKFDTPEAFQEALEQNNLTDESLRALLTRNLGIQALVEQEIAGAVTVTDAEVHDFFTGNRDKFEVPEQARARHILVKVDENADEPAKKAAAAKAEGLLAQLKSGADFEELAIKSSDCPSAPQGGDLGFFTRGQMVPAFDEAAFALKPGELSGVVVTRFGFHIIKLEEKKDAGVVPEQEAAPKIREYLVSRKTEDAVEQRLKMLREKAKIVVLMKF